VWTIQKEKRVLNRLMKEIDIKGFFLYSSDFVVKLDVKLTVKEFFPIFNTRYFGGCLEF